MGRWKRSKLLKGKDKFTWHCLVVSVVVVLHSNVSASKFPHHFFVHRRQWRYQNRSGSQGTHSRDLPRFEATLPASSAHIPHRYSGRWAVPVHHDVHTQRQG